MAGAWAKIAAGAAKAMVTNACSDNIYQRFQ